MGNQNTVNWAAIAGAIAAAVLAIVQGMQHVAIQDNHVVTHERIDGIEQVIVPRKEIDNRFMNKSSIQVLQATHTEQIGNLEQDVKFLKEYQEDELENN